MKIKERISEHKKIIISIIFILLPILLELIFFSGIKFEKSTLIRIAIIYAIEFMYIFYKILNKFQDKVKKVLDFIIKKRYIIVAIVFVICVLCKINLSSINMWGRYLNETEVSKNILGVSREIRADEWLVQSPLFLAQTKNEDGYTIRNEHIMQGNSNLLMNGAPVWDLTTISKPLTWGFLLFGTENGFSWWWMLRILLLLVVSFELARIISKKDNLLSITGMLLLGIAPGIMWWLSTAIVDAYIWGVAIIVLFHYYMENLNWKIYKKLLIALGMVISIPAFAFALYPAYQVPLAFVIIIFLINDLIKHWKELKKKDYIIMGASLILSVGILVSFIISAWPDIQTMMGTVYPGARFETGGDYTIDQFTSMFTNLFLPYTKAIANPCEISTYMFPVIGLAILIIHYFKNKKKDDKKVKNSDKFLEIGLMLLFGFLFTWIYIGFNEFFARITFLYFSTTERTQLVLGLLGVILVLMLLKKFQGEKTLNKKQSIIISVATVAIAYILIKNSSYNAFFTTIKLEILAVVLFSSTYTLIRGNKKAFCYIMCIVAIIAGAAINPIVSGTDIMYETSIAKEIQKIYQEDKEALWVGRYNWSGQYLLANGVNVLNGVNTYPNFEWIEKLDPERKYDEVYNRYAHIGIILSDHTEFRLLTQDSYEVEVSYEDFKKLNVKYYFTDTKLTDEVQEDFHASMKYENDDKKQYIYEFSY